MQLKELIGQAGVVRVNLAPLLLIIGAAMAGDGDLQVEDLMNMLDPEMDSS
jgi:hypothetical protein